MSNTYYPPRYLVGQLRTDRGEFNDKGCYVIDARHHDFSGGVRWDGVKDDGEALVDAVDFANSLLADPATSNLRTTGIEVRVPAGPGLCGQPLLPFSGVVIGGSDRFSSLIKFSLPNTYHGIVFDAATTGHTALGGNGYGGGLRNLKLTTVSYLVDGQTCDTMVKFKGIVFPTLENVTLHSGGGRLLHIENCIDGDYRKVWASLNNGDCGIWISGSTTTQKFDNVYQSQCKSGPGWLMSGEALSFYSCIAESNGITTASGAYGFQLKYGSAAWYSPYCEDNGDHDIYAGSEDYAGSARTTVSIYQPKFVTGATKLSGKGGIYVDYVDHLTISGGDVGSIPKPLTMTANTGQVVVDADFGASGKTPELASGDSWRSKRNLVWVNQQFVAQSATKAAVTAAGGTAILDIPTTQSLASFLLVYAEVVKADATSLRVLVEIRIGREGEGQTDGGAVVTLLGNDSTGNFQVAGTDFVTTYPSASVTRVTYTSSNVSGDNIITFQATGLGLAGDLSIT